MTERICSGGREKRGIRHPYVWGKGQDHRSQTGRGEEEGAFREMMHESLDRDVSSLCIMCVFVYVGMYDPNLKTNCHGHGHCHGQG